MKDAATSKSSPVAEPPKASQNHESKKEASQAVGQPSKGQTQAPTRKGTESKSPSASRNKRKKRSVQGRPEDQARHRHMENSE